MLTGRLCRRELVSTSLAGLDDYELAALVDAAPTGAVGVGGSSSLLDVDSVPVFVKRIPITDRELAHPHSTTNLFDVPTHCQYGIPPRWPGLRCVARAGREHDRRGGSSRR